MPPTVESFPRPSPSPPLPAFQGVGLALDYAIIDQVSLNVLPIADRLLAAADDLEFAAPTHHAYAWRDGLALHLLEIRHRTPMPTLQGVAAGLAGEIAAIGKILQQNDALLLPGGMHPWMDPSCETRLRQDAHGNVYHHVERLFDCTRHGWTNLHGVRLYLPFANDAEFARLHAAIRVVLPLIPALTAGSPFAAGIDSGCADHRLAVWGDHATRLAVVSGDIIAPTLSSHEEYDSIILAPARAAMAPLDPHGLLRQELICARGAIARFDHHAIGITLADTQECPRADVAVAGAITAVVRMLYTESTSSLESQQAIDTSTLATVLQRCVRSAEQAELSGDVGAAYLALLGYPRAACSAQHLWRYLIRSLPREPGIDDAAMAALDHILEHGTLATRLRRATHGDASPARLHTLYRRLTDCLAQNRMFGGQRSTLT